MTKIQMIPVVLCFSLLLACSSENKRPEKPKGCLESVPESIDGLEVKGVRSKKNAIKNMWPLTCRALELYRERRRVNPNLKGTLTLRLLVEFNGEIGPFSIARSTLEDSVLENQVLDLIRFAEFDVYGPHNSESEILYPIHFRP